MNPYDTANQLEQEIRKMPEFLKLQETMDAIKANEETKELFKAFQQTQMDLQGKQMRGEEFTEEDSVRAQEIAEKVQGDALITELMNAEQTFSNVMNDFNQIIMSPVRDLYNLD